MLSSSDATLVERDAEIPGLAIVLDPSEFAALIEKQSSLTIKKIETSYVRYKPKTSCLVSYHVTTANDAFDIYTTAYRTGAEDKIRKAKTRVRELDKMNIGNVVWERQKIVGNVFPNDDKLKSLRLMDDPNWRTRLLQKKLPCLVNPENSLVEKLAYKPERRYVGKVMVAGRPVAAVKLYAQNEYQGALRNANAFHCGTTYRVPRFYGYKNRRGILMFEWVPGQTLEDIILIKTEFLKAKIN